MYAAQYYTIILPLGGYYRLASASVSHLLLQLFIAATISTTFATLSGFENVRLIDNWTGDVLTNESMGMERYHTERLA